jgi:TonB family protein
LLRYLAVGVLAVLLNGGLYLLVPYIQVLIQRKAVAAHKAPKAVTTAVSVAPPEEKQTRKQVIKEIKTVAYTPPSMSASRPTNPGGGLKIDLSPAGGEGLGLTSGNNRTGGIGSGSGDGKGLGAMTYEPGQTDTDAKPIGPDPALEYPARAEREGVTGFVDLTFVVTETGSVEQITLLKEEPGGYYFGNAAVECVKKMKFKPATLQKMSVRQRFKRRFNFDL